MSDKPVVINIRSPWYGGDRESVVEAIREAEAARLTGMARRDLEHRRRWAAIQAGMFQAQAIAETAYAERYAARPWWYRAGHTVWRGVRRLVRRPVSHPTMASAMMHANAAAAFQAAASVGMEEGER